MTMYRTRRHVASTVIAASMLAILSGSAAIGGASAAKTTTLTFSHWYTWPAARAFLDASVASFEKDNPGVKVKLQPTEFATYMDKLLVSAAAGKAPDVVMVSGIWLGTASGVLTDMDSLAKAEKFDKSATYEPMLRGTSWKGTLLAMPFGGGVQRALYWNKNMFAKAGLDPDKAPVLWSDFLEAMQRITFDRNGDGKPDQSGTDWATPLFQMLHVEGGGDYTTNRGLGTDIDAPAGQKAFAFLKELGRYGALASLGSFAAGRCATTTDGPWQLTEIQKTAKFKWGFSHFPIPTAEKPPRFYASADALGITKAVAGRRSLAVKFVKHMIGEEVQGQLAVTVGFPAMNRRALNTAVFRRAAEADPNLVIANDMMKYAFAPYPSPRDNDLMTLSAKYRDLAMYGKIDPRKAADDMQMEATKLLARYQKK